MDDVALETMDESARADSGSARGQPAQR